jgi:hypothetical protein
MEANQTTCPQCGLVNNHLAEACAQCGLIFVKNKSEETSQTLLDEQKSKAIEEAEAILDQTLPPPETDAVGDPGVKKIEMSEDTIEMQIPVETTASGIPEKPELEENQDTETYEIDMEAIEAPAEIPADKRALFIGNYDNPNGGRNGDRDCRNRYGSRGRSGASC